MAKLIESGTFLHDDNDASDSDQSDTMEMSMQSTASAPYPKGGAKAVGSKERRYKDIWRDAAMTAAASLHNISDENWPPRDGDGNVPAWVSEGSRSHLAKQCKPCAFYHAQGCQSGSACKFCHLCPPREVQRRKRLRRRLAREQLAQEQGWFGSFRERFKSSISRQAEAASS